MKVTALRRWFWRFRDLESQANISAARGYFSNTLVATVQHFLPLHRTSIQYDTHH